MQIPCNFKLVNQTDMQNRVDNTVLVVVLETGPLNAFMKEGILLENFDLHNMPPDLEKLQKLWPHMLTHFAKQGRSPVDPDELIDKMRQDEKFQDLVNGWENMPTAAQANAWDMIQDRLWEAVRESRPYCVRCGECCRLGSPVLYDQDRPLLAQNVFRAADLMTLRHRETAYSHRENKMVELDRERIKLREKRGGGGCIYLSPGGDACLIYENRPHQCRVMDCWDPSRFSKLLPLPPLTRVDLLGKAHPLVAVIERHEERCGPDLIYKELSGTSEPAPEVMDNLLDMVLYDLHLREFAMNKFGITENELEFYFGRSLALLAATHGYRLETNPDGSPTFVRTTEPAENGL
jgi:Fe-S-cluster containining protein